jgi:hypothetical protein
MQMAEILIWWGIENNNDTINKIGTKYGKYLLPTHNIAIGLGIYYHTKDIRPIIVGLIFNIYILLLYDIYSDDYDDITKPRCESNNCNEDSGKLRWGFPHKWYTLSFIISLILVINYVKPIQVGIIQLLFYILTFLIVSLIDIYKVWGSSWCWFASFMSPIIVIVNTLLIRNYECVIS